MNTFESVAFDHIDKRVLEYLQGRISRQHGNIVHLSHLELANELGTTRVVISRILKQFELDQKVKLWHSNRAVGQVKGARTSY